MKKYGVRYGSSGNLLFRHFHEGRIRPGRCFRAERQIESRTLSLNDSILRMEYTYREEYGDGVAVQFTFVKNGLLYTRRVELRNVCLNGHWI